MNQEKYELQMNDDGQIEIPVGYILDLIYERDKQAVEKWILDRCWDCVLVEYPHGYSDIEHPGLYD